MSLEFAGRWWLRLDIFEVSNAIGGGGPYQGLTGAVRLRPCEMSEQPKVSEAWTCSSASFGLWGDVGSCSLVVNRELAG